MLDSSTWQQYQKPTGTVSFSQSGALFITAPSSSVDAYTAFLQPIGVGQGIRVDVDLLQPLSAASLRLTNNSGGANGDPFSDTQFASVVIHDLSNSITEQIGNWQNLIPPDSSGNPWVASAGWPYTSSSSSLNLLRTLELRYVSPTQINFAIYDSIGNILVTDLRTFNDPFAGPLFPELSAFGSTKFDNVVIVPEPGAPLLTLGAIMVLALCRLGRNR